MVQPNGRSTWELIQSGQTKGVFQCESPLVQKWLKRLKPKNIWELSAVIALVRPGALLSGFTDQYAINKDKIDSGQPIETFGHPIVDDIFKINNGVLIYQENLMQLGMRLAWPNLPEKEKLVEVDNLRKAVGKKDQKKILEIGQKFVQGCISQGVSQEVADKLFEAIKKSGRYLFNLSHSYAYAQIAYKTAYLKTNHPKEFFEIYLNYSGEKQDKWLEKKLLIHDCYRFNIPIYPPNINHGNANFQIENEGIRYGLGHVKYVNASKIDEFNRSVNTIDEFVKLVIEGYFNTNTIEALICVNAFADLNISRSALLNAAKLINELTSKESSQLNNVESLLDLVSQIQSLKTSSTRKEKLKSVISLHNINVEDNPGQIEIWETFYLGVPITCSRLNAKIRNDHTYIQDANLDFDYLPIYSERQIAVILDDIEYRKIKTGKNAGKDMANIHVHDNSGELRYLPVFADLLSASNQLLINNNTLDLTIAKGKTGWIVKNITQL